MEKRPNNCLSGAEAKRLLRGDYSQTDGGSIPVNDKSFWEEVGFKLTELEDVEDEPRCSWIKTFSAETSGRRR